MKRFCPYIILAVFLLSVAVTAGCSAATPAGQTADIGTQTSETIDSVSKSPAETSPDQTPAAAGSGWDVVLTMAISQPANMVGFLNEKQGITVGYAGEIHYTDDGGQTWPQAENNSLCRFCLDIVDSNIVWSGGNGNNVRMSNDGGKTWNAVTDIDLGGAHTNISFVDNTTGWIASLNKLAATADGGKTWKELVVPDGASGIAAICLRTPKDGYLLAHNGLFFITADGGATWSKQDLGFANYKIADQKKQPSLYKTNNALADISFTDEKSGTIVFIGLIPGEGNHAWCLTTADGGETWKSEMIPQTGFSPNKLFLSKDGKYLTLCSNTNQTVVLKREGLSLISAIHLDFASTFRYNIK